MRRESYLAGETEQREWRANNVFGAAERYARLKAIQEWDHDQKKKGQPWGPLGPNGMKVAGFLYGRRCYKSGQLDPAISEMAATLKLSIQTIVSTIARLVDAKLLVKLRRTQRVDDPKPSGPQVEQISNAYWFRLPQAIRARVAQLLAKGGKPADQAQHEADQEQAVAAMLATLSAEDMAAFHAGDHGPLAAAVKSLGRAFDRSRRAIPTVREFSDRTV